MTEKKQQKPKPVQKARDAGTGQYIPLDEAKRRPATTVVERGARKKK